MINVYKTNTRLITNTYINLDYIKSKEKLISFLSNDAILTNIRDSFLFLNDLCEYVSNNKTGVRNDRVVNYGIVLTFMINNFKIKNNKLLLLSKEIIKQYNLSEYPYFCVSKHYKKSLYLSIYVCERKYYKTPKLFQVKAKQTRYKNDKGCYCKSSDKEAKLVYKEGDIIRSYYSKFSSKTQRFRFANSHQFLYEMNKYKLMFIEICVKCLKEQVVNTITFKRCSLKQLDFKEKNIAKIWIKSYEEMESSFSRTYQDLVNVGKYASSTYGEQEKIYKSFRHDLITLFNNYNEIIINNYQTRTDKQVKIKHFYMKPKKKIGFSVDLNADIKTAKEGAKNLKILFNKNLKKILDLYINSYALSSIPA